jgi:hypothetical protein
LIWCFLGASNTSLDTKLVYCSSGSTSRFTNFHHIKKWWGITVISIDMFGERNNRKNVLLDYLFEYRWGTKLRRVGLWEVDTLRAGACWEMEQSEMWAGGL